MKFRYNLGKVILRSQQVPIKFFSGRRTAVANYVKWALLHIETFYLSIAAPLSLLFVWLMYKSCFHM